jgi:hypothetical protein
MQQAVNVNLMAPGANYPVEVFGMEMVALATLGIGLALGLRFRVIVLIPAILVAVTLITAGALAQGATLGSIAVMNIAGAVCLQFGYLGGTILAALTIAEPFGGAKRHRPHLKN